MLIPWEIGLKWVNIIACILRVVKVGLLSLVIKMRSYSNRKGARLVMRLKGKYSPLFPQTTTLMGETERE